MKINHERIQEKLKNVPQSKRSYIYDASTVLHFLNDTFMPTRFFVPSNFTGLPGKALTEEHFIKFSRERRMTLRDLYDLYIKYREEKDWTSEIESRYTFSILIRHLRAYQNKWEFSVHRVGRAQLWFVGPLVLRTDVPANILEKYPIEEKFVGKDENLVEADPVINDNEEDDTEENKIDDGFDNTNLKYDRDLNDMEPDENRFQEANFELPPEEDSPAIVPTEDY